MKSACLSVASFVLVSTTVTLGAAFVCYPQPYHCTVLDIPSEASWGNGEAINEAGQVAGQAGGGGYQRAIIWDSVTPTVLGLPSGGVGSYALDINDSGQAAGMATVDGTNYPVRWDNGVPILMDLPPRTVDWGDVRAINSNAQVAGRQQSPGVLEPVRWDGTTVVELKVQPYSKGDPYDIDDSGNVVGGVLHPAYGWQPAQWIGLDPHALTLPDGQDEGYAYATNNSGQIVGRGKFNDPIRWDSGVPTTLDLPAGTSLGSFNAISDINDQGQAVGWVLDNYTIEEFPVIWNGTTPEFLPMPDDAWQGYALGINNSGQIAGRVNIGTTNLPVRWDPCTDEDGYYLEGETCGEIDCDDSDPDVNPGMTEIPNNGVDDDCDPSTPDQPPWGVATSAEASQPGDVGFDESVILNNLTVFLVPIGVFLLIRGAWRTRRRDYHVKKE